MIGKGRKIRSAPVIAPVRKAVEDYLALCPYALKPDGPLFVGAKGGRLSPRIVQLAMERCAARSACPTPPRRTRSAIPSPPTSWRAAAICAPSRICSATPRFRRTQVYTGVDSARLLAAYKSAHPRRVSPRRRNSACRPTSAAKERYEGRPVFVPRLP